MQWVYHVFIPVLLCIHFAIEWYINFCKSVFEWAAVLWFLVIPRSQPHTHSCSPEILLLETVWGQSVIQIERRFVENLFLKIIICVSGSTGSSAKCSVRYVSRNTCFIVTSSRWPEERKNTPLSFIWAKCNFSDYSVYHTGFYFCQELMD